MATRKPTTTETLRLLLSNPMCDRHAVLMLLSKIAHGSTKFTSASTAPSDLTLR